MTGGLVPVVTYGCICPVTQTCLVFLRDSKLTRILEDSIGGNCKTTMMAMISPALEAYSGKALEAAFITWHT